MATALGFTNDAAFNRAYRAAFGMKPSEAADALCAVKLLDFDILIADCLKGVTL